LTTSSNRKKFVLMAIGMSKGGDSLDGEPDQLLRRCFWFVTDPNPPRPEALRQSWLLKPLPEPVVEQTNRGEGAYDIALSLIKSMPVLGKQIELFLRRCFWFVTDPNRDFLFGATGVPEDANNRRFAG
jgi:hypothetical protein